MLRASTREANVLNTSLMISYVHSFRRNDHDPAVSPFTRARLILYVMHPLARFIAREKDEHERKEGRKARASQAEEQIGFLDEFYRRR